MDRDIEKIMMDNKGKIVEEGGESNNGSEEGSEEDRDELVRSTFRA